MANAPGEELVFMALGGIGEIGMNCYLYGLGPPDARKWLMIDLGITFPEGENDPGIDVILPDLRFIEEERSNLAGLVLTHAHEDHLGAVIELWPRLRVPIYATPFTAAMLKSKETRTLPISQSKVGRGMEGDGVGRVEEQREIWIQITSCRSRASAAGASAQLLRRHRPFPRSRASGGRPIRCRW